MNDFIDMRENESGFRPDNDQPRVMRMAFERGQGGGPSLPNFKETAARLNADSGDKEATQDLLTLGRIASKLNIVQRAQEDILNQKLRALPLPEQTTQLANDFEQSLLDDPNLPYRDNRDSLGGLGRAVYFREMELRRRQFEEGQSPENQDNPAAAFYPRNVVDYVHLENNQPQEPPKSEPRTVRGTVIGLKEGVEPIEPTDQEDDKDPFGGTADFRPNNAGTTPPGNVPPTPPPPENPGDNENESWEPIIPPGDDWDPNRGNPYATASSAGGMSSEAEENIRKIAEFSERTAKSAEEAEPEVVKIPEPNPEFGEAGWIASVFEWLDKAESLAEAEKKTSYEDQDSRIWLAIERLIAKAPDEARTQTEFVSPDGTVVDLNNLFREQFPEGIGLKEKLLLYYNARKRLMDRYIETDRAGGSLASYGVNREEMSIEVLKNPLTEVEPMDWWLIIHSDELFKQEISAAPEQVISPDQKREILANVDDALSVWWNVGALAYGDNRELNSYLRAERFGSISVTYKDVLNDISKESTLHAEIQKILWNVAEMREYGPESVALESGRQLRKGEQLAHRIFTATLTMPLFDKERKSFQGKGEERDIMHIDRKRIGDYMEKGRVPGNQWTIGRFWNVPKQDQVRPKEGMESEVAKYRKQMVEINSERGVFLLPENGYDKGELISDYFHTAVGVPDAMTGKVVYMKLINFAIDKTGRSKFGGWKQIPLYNLGENSYSGYFTYNMGIASNIAEGLGKGGFKPEEIQDTNYWGKKKTLLDRLETISPWFNTVEYDYRGYHLRSMLTQEGFDAEKVARIAGYSSEQDIKGLGFTSDEEMRIVEIAMLEEDGQNIIARRAKADADVFKANQQHKFRMVAALGDVWDGSLDYIRGVGAFDARSRFSASDIRKITQAIKQSGYLSGEYLAQFEREVQEMGFGVRIPLIGEVKRYRVKKKNN